PRTSMSRPETLSLTMRLSFAETVEEHSDAPLFWATGLTGEVTREEVLEPGAKPLPCRKFFMRHDTFCALR
ncbi:hypothetical protein KR067_005566, partial [Drosophila pandora]